MVQRWIWYILQKEQYIKSNHNILCFIINFHQEKIKKTKTYNTLKFSYKFEHDNDTVYFAQSFPYTYS